MTFPLAHDVPDDLSYLLEQLGRDVTSGAEPAQRSVPLFRLLDRAGETGLRNNVNFA